MFSTIRLKMSRPISKNLSWALADSVIPRVIQAAKLFFVARILGPKEFGVYALAIVILGVAEGLSEFGVRQAVIHSKNEVSTNTVRSVNFAQFLRGLLILIFLMSFGHVYSGSKPPLVIFILIGLIPMARGAYLASFATLMRELKYKKLMLFNLFFRISDVFAIVLMFIFFEHTGINSIVALVAGEYFAVILSCIILGADLRFTTLIKDARDLFQYGKWIWGQSVVTMIINQFDKLYVASQFGTAMVGGYQGVNRVLQMSIADPIMMATGIWFPKITKDLRLNREKTEHQFSIILIVLVNVLTFMLMVLYYLKDILILFVLGNTWSEFSYFVPVFASTMSLGAVVNLLVMWHRANGSPHIVTYGVAIQGVIYCICIFVFGRSMGALGVAQAVNISLSAITVFLFIRSPKGGGLYVSWLSLFSIIIAAEIVCFVKNNLIVFVVALILQVITVYGAYRAIKARV